MKNAPAITEYYAGPVLFEDGACSSVFISNFLKRGALFTYRKPDTDQAQPVKMKSALIKAAAKEKSIFNLG